MASMRWVRVPYPLILDQRKYMRAGIIVEKGTEELPSISLSLRRSGASVCLVFLFKVFTAGLDNQQALNQCETRLSKHANHCSSSHLKS